MKQSIKPNIWGPHGWKFMHYVSLGYPDNPSQQDKNNYKRFYYSLKDVLPCDKCATNYETNITEYPIDNHLDSRESLIKWVVDIHNKVNVETGKNELSYEDATELYRKGDAAQMIEYCFRIIVLIIVLVFIYYLSLK